MLWDFKTKKGSLYHKIAYHRYGKGKKTNHDRESADLPIVSDSEEINELECLLFFRTCVVDRDIDILKIKLVQTLEFRQRLIRKKETIFHKAFPFYFIRPELVMILFRSSEFNILNSVY